MKEIPNFTGYYIDEQGKVYTTLAKGCRDRYDMSKRIEPKELKHRTLPNGYLRVYMRRDDDNKRVDVYIHRLVGEVFIPNPNNLSEINHKDCNRSNNNVNNLEWVSRKENLEYALLYGNMKRDSKGRFSNKYKV